MPAKSQTTYYLSKGDALPLMKTRDKHFACKAGRHGYTVTQVKVNREGRKTCRILVRDGELIPLHLTQKLAADRVE
jgi:hypothetical protein